MARGFGYSVALGALAFAASTVAMASAAPRSGDGVEAKARAIVSRMTLEEKMALIRGEVEPYPANQGQAGYLTGVPRFHIPPLRLADGPPGVLTRMPSPALTATMGLAATFSRRDSRLNGVVIGDEANRLGIGVSLQPFVNLDRDISFSRGYNTYGEDPVLTGAIGAALIGGIQSRGVMAQVKHFIGYDTNAMDVTIDEQSLHEVYLAPFDAAVKAGVSSIMCSYNRINGPYACGNKALLTGVLRGELGFSGFVTSDWGAVHDYDYLPQGLDMEMSGRPAADNPFMFFSRAFFDTVPPAALQPPDMSKVANFIPVTGGMPEEPAAKPFSFDMIGVTAKMPPYRNAYNAMKDGVLAMPMIDQAATRVLGQIIRFGYLDGSRARLVATPSGVSIPSVIRSTSADAAVLLKNEGHLLPLAGSGPIVLIGPTARQVAAIGKSGERSVGIVAHQVGPYDALRQTMPNADIRLAVGYDMMGVPVPASAFGSGLAHSRGGAAVGNDAQIDFTGARALPAGTDHVWEGTITVPSAGRTMLAVQTLGTRGTIIVDGKTVAATSGAKGALHGDIVEPGNDDLLPTTDGLNNARGAIELAAGPHKLRVEAKADISGAPVQVRLSWITPAEQEANRAGAIAAARAARTAVVFAWSRGDPLFRLPGDQDAFIEEVAAANPNTIVVLNVSQPVAMPWLGKVKAVLQMWWPGDEGGWATADVLSGRKNPAGRLPFTWAARLEDYAPQDPAHPERTGNTPDHKAVFSEGVNIGYRWFDQQGVRPLYPFGYGLSYTRFDYSGLKVTKAADGGFDVHFMLRNSGPVDGEEVPQVYVSAPATPAAGVQFAADALAGFERVFVKAGQSRPVTIHVDRRRTQYWSVARHAWVDAASTRTLRVASSSRDPKLQTSL